MHTKLVGKVPVPKTVKTMQSKLIVRFFKKIPPISDNYCYNKMRMKEFNILMEEFQIELYEYKGVTYCFTQHVTSIDYYYLHC